MLSVYLLTEDIKKGLIDKPIIIEAVKENFKTKEAIKDLTATLWVMAAANDGQIQQNLSSAATIIEKHFNIETFSIGDAMQPKWVQTEQAKAIFNKLVEAGFCTDMGRVYRWESTKDLFAYFASRLSDELKLRPSNGKTPWRVIASAFDNISKDDIEKTIKTSHHNTKNEYKNMPVGWSDIEKIVTCK